MFNKNLFICVPNNSGSSFLTKAIELSNTVLYLPKEGHFINGYSGPIPPKYGFMMHWAYNANFVNHVLKNENCYNWDEIKSTWKHHIKGNGELFVEKSPPNVARVELLKNNFNNSKFIFSVRNPYATIEGILRSQKKKVTLRQATIHVINTYKLQLKNIEEYKNQSIFFTYEELCDNPTKISKKITKLCPEISSVNFNQNISVKSRYNSHINNFNEEQIKRLSINQISEITNILAKHQELLSYFNYKLIK